MAIRTGFVVCLLAGLSVTARAHPVTVDGDPADWLGRAPAEVNTAVVARGAGPVGEFVWSDATGDERTDFASPDGRVDLVSFATTADATHLYFLVEVADLDLAVGDGAPQIQVALDLDRVAASGQEFLAGFSDTTVPTDARWEFLVQTTASPDLGVQVYDTSFAVAGTGTIARSGDRFEIGVPWTALGLTAPPAAVRMSVALFRQDTSAATFDISGASDALDVLSNDGDPGTTPNTFAEMMDGVLDHSVDVHFDTDGEVIAPLQIVRYLSDSSAFVDHVVLRNSSGGELDLGSFAVGDEETANQPEGMLRLPSRMLAAGAELVVSFGAAGAYESAFGEAPGAEASALSVRGRWSAGSVSLDASGDELLVLDGSDTVVDVVTFGAGTYPGVGVGPTAATDELSLREPIDQDTDATGDFVARGACAADGDCGACGLCMANVCGLRVSGTPCDDGDMCTSGETCDDTGICGGGAPSCEDAGVDEDGGMPTDAGVPDGGSGDPDGGASGSDGGSLDAGDARRDEGGCGVAGSSRAPGVVFVVCVLLWRRRSQLSQR